MFQSPLAFVILNGPVIARAQKVTCLLVLLNCPEWSQAASSATNNTQWKRFTTALKSRDQSDLVEWNCPYSVNTFTSVRDTRLKPYIIFSLHGVREWETLAGLAEFSSAVMAQRRHQCGRISCDFTHDTPKGIHPNVGFYFESQCELWFQKNTTAFCWPLIFFAAQLLASLHPAACLKMTTTSTQRVEMSDSDW